MAHSIASATPSLQIRPTMDVENFHSVMKVAKPLALIFGAAAAIGADKLLGTHLNISLTNIFQDPLISSVAGILTFSAGYVGHTLAYYFGHTAAYHSSGFTRSDINAYHNDNENAEEILLIESDQTMTDVKEIIGSQIQTERDAATTVLSMLGGAAGSSLVLSR